MSQSMKSLLMRTGLMSAVIGVASPAALAAVVEGKVTAGGAGVQGAVVEVVETGQSVSTDEAGEYRFGALPAGEYTLSVSYIGTEDKSASVIATDENATTLNFALDDELRILDSIIVTGQRGSLFAGINQQRAADNVISVISADALGQFPDQNVAESVRRVAGISVANDQGEGRYVTIRGLNSDLNAVSVNGVRMTSPEADTRSVALDVVDSDILDSIEIVKSLTPDLDGDGIGGSINIKTLSAFDKEGLYVKAKADAIYSESSEETTPKLGLTVSKTIADKLGIAGSISYNKRDFFTPNVEADGLITDGALVFPEELELRHYEVTRERISSALNFDYHLTNNTDLYLRTLYNSFEDQEYRHRWEIKPNDGGLDTPYTNNGGVLTFTVGPDDYDPDEDEEAVMEFDRDIKNRKETQKIWSVQTGGETRMDAYTFEYQVAYTHAEEEEPDRLDTAFRTKLKGGKSDTFNLVIDNSDWTLPQLVGGSDEIFDADEYEFDEVEHLNGITEEDELALKFDIKREGFVLGQPGFVKGGVKTRFRSKDFETNTAIYDGFDGDDDYLLSAFPYTPDYGLGTFGPSADPGELKSFFFENQDLFELNTIDTALANYAERYKAFEDIYAGYVMAQADFGTALFTGGFRVEATNFTGKGWQAVQFEYEGEFDGDFASSLTPAGTLLASVFEEGEDDEPGEGARVYADYVTERDTYVDFLPSFNGRFDVSPNIVGRVAYYQSIARPSIKQKTPAAEVEKDDAGEYKGVIGNPDLERQQANNIDLALEWYPSRQGVLSFGVFYKDIKDPVAEIVAEDYEAFGVTFEEAELFQNLDDASVTGLEFNYQQVFDEILPGALGGLIFGLNYTIVDSQTTYISDNGDARSIPMPQTSDEIANVVFGYDKYGLDLRLALSYRSGYLDELSTDGESDRYYQARQQLDFTAKYDITDNLTVVGEISNLTDEEEHAVFNTPYGSALSQYDEYGYTAKFGLRYTY